MTSTIVERMQIEDTDARGREVIETALARHGVEPENYVSYRAVSFVAGREGNTFVFDDSDSAFYDGKMAAIAVLPYEDYLALAPDSELPMPGADEVLVYGRVPAGETVNLDGLSMRIAGRIDSVSYTHLHLRGVQRHARLVDRPGVIHARRANQLRDDDALGAVDDKRAVLGHEREIAHEHLGLLDLVSVAVRQPHGCLLYTSRCV